MATEYFTYQQLDDKWKSSHGNDLGAVTQWLAGEWFWGEGSFIDASTSGHIKSLVLEQLEGRSENRVRPLTRLFHSFAPWDVASANEAVSMPVEVVILAGDTGAGELRGLVESVSKRLMPGRSLVLGIGSDLQVLEGMFQDFNDVKIGKIADRDGFAIYGRVDRESMDSTEGRAASADAGARSSIWTPPAVLKKADGAQFFVTDPGPIELTSKFEKEIQEIRKVSEERLNDPMLPALDEQRRIERELRVELEQALTRSARLQVQHQTLVQEKEDLWRWCEPIVAEVETLRKEKAELWEWAEPMIAKAQQPESPGGLPRMVGRKLRDTIRKTRSDGSQKS
jgi:hypothetical protein